MIKNDTFLFLFLVAVTPMVLSAQEIKIFTTADFDLKAKVKSCLVITDYGKEEYDFDENGRLTKSVTRYNDHDHDITQYKYIKGELIEKRVEHYRDGTFDSGTSIALFYTIDTTADRKVTEKIVSYDKELLEQNEYHYADDKLVKIVRTDTQGTDEALIEYDTIKNEATKTYKLNGSIQESVRTSERTDKDGSIQKVVLIKKFLDGDPKTATEKIFDDKDLMVSKVDFFHDSKSGQFVPQGETIHTYDDNGMLTKKVVKIGKTTEVQEYIYQFDNGDAGNWIKQIITPDNTYTTRKITYYEAQVEEEEE